MFYRVLDILLLNLKLLCPRENLVYRPSSKINFLLLFHCVVVRGRYGQLFCYQYRVKRRISGLRCKRSGLIVGFLDPSGVGSESSEVESEPWEVGSESSEVESEPSEVES